MPTIYIVITQDHQRTYRFAVRQHLRHTTAMMVSRPTRQLSDAKREAQRLFGALAWRSGSELGLQDFVEAAAVAETGPGIW